MNFPSWFETKAAHIWYLSIFWFCASPLQACAYISEPGVEAAEVPPLI